MAKKVYLRLSYDEWEDGNGWILEDSILEIEEQNRTVAEVAEEVNSAADIGYIARIWKDYITGDGEIDLLDSIDEDGEWISATEINYNVKYWLVDSKNDVGDEEEAVLIGSYCFRDRDVATYLWNEK